MDYLVILVISASVKQAAEQQPLPQNLRSGLRKLETRLSLTKRGGGLKRVGGGPKGGGAPPPSPEIN